MPGRPWSSGSPATSMRRGPSSCRFSPKCARRYRISSRPGRHSKQRPNRTTTAAAEGANTRGIYDVAISGRNSECRPCRTATSKKSRPASRKSRRTSWTATTDPFFSLTTTIPSALWSARRGGTASSPWRASTPGRPSRSAPPTPRARPFPSYGTSQRTATSTNSRGDSSAAVKKTTTPSSGSTLSTLPSSSRSSGASSSETSRSESRSFATRRLAQRKVRSPSTGGIDSSVCCLPRSRTRRRTCGTP
mmetsp:Transcript_11669/g.38387  ORF Transcript_11669/g.38387 Transcript_11669/m.38387 type:complete len:248 (-) Transcript_11669:252-995(-)